MSDISISNRNEAYKEVLKTLGKRQEQVFNCIKLKGPLNSEQIKQHLSFDDKCSVTGRLKELEERCLINPISTLEGKTVYEITPEENSLFLRNDRKAKYILTIYDLEQDLTKELSVVSLSMIHGKIIKLKKLISLL